jgi:hypothetical protein
MSFSKKLIIIIIIIFMIVLFLNSRKENLLDKNNKCTRDSQCKSKKCVKKSSRSGRKHCR